MKIFSIMVLTLCIFGLLGVYGGLIIRDITFTQNCGGFLKQAADANTIELAQEKLAKAAEYAEAKGLTEGYTSIIYKTPDEDIGFWFKNLTASLAELKSVDPNATLLEKTNVLMKLRESLLDDGDEGTKVTLPAGISKFPYNKSFFWVQILLWLFCCVPVGFMMYDYMNQGEE
jgi:hypothetical protein